MTASLVDQVNLEDIRELDGQYRPIPNFEEFLAASEVEDTPWERLTAGVQRKQADGAQVDFDRAVRVALRAAAVDTGAIEGLYKVDRGFTVTVAEEHPGWEEGAEGKGTAFRQLFASQLRGYELAHELAAGDMPMNEAWIRELHSEITAGQQTYRVWVPSIGKYQRQALPRGQYKTQSNHVKRPDGAWHAYAPVDEVPAEVRRLLEQTRTPGFEAAHPSLQAAYAHYAFVVIHPFADGNGRVARAIASNFLIKSCGVPLVIWSDQDDEYLDALRMADHGDYQAFVDFIFDRALDTIGDVAGRMGPTLDKAVAGLRSLFQTQGGLSHSELEQVGVGIIGILMNIVKDRIGSLSLPKHVACWLPVDSRERFASEDENYRIALQHDPGVALVRFESRAPVKVGFDYRLQLLIAKERDARYPFLLRRIDPRDEFHVRFADAYPEVSDSLKHRIDAWVERILAEGLQSLAQQAEQSLRKAGY